MPKQNLERDEFVIANALLLGVDFIVCNEPKGWASCVLDNRVLYRAPTKAKAAEGALSTLGFWCYADPPYGLVRI